MAKFFRGGILGARSEPRPVSQLTTQLRALPSARPAPSFSSMAVIALLLSALTAPALQSPPPSVQPTLDAKVKVCVADFHTLGRIMVGHRSKQITLSLGGGGCGGPMPHIELLLARVRDDENASNVVAGSDCPAFRKQVAELWALKPRHKPKRGEVAGVEVRPFTIFDPIDLFDLRSSGGRAAAAQWVRRTLNEVQPCWNTIRDDRTRSIVDGLYSSLRL